MQKDSKACPICGEEKPIGEFYRYFSKVRGKYRISNYCKPCARAEGNERGKAHYRDNAEQKKQYAKQYRLANPEKIKANSARFTKKYREELKGCYVAEFASKALKCSTKDIHGNPELLEAYRNNMKLKRTIRNHGKQ